MGKLTEDVVLARNRSSDLSSVKRLNLWGTELDDVKIMRLLGNVEVVSLSVNDITTLADFQDCQNLQELYIRKNKIRNLNEICYLKKLPKLRMLWLADNPCATGRLYRMTVLRNLPNLVKLDNIVVEQDELNDALEQGMELSLPEPASTTSSSTTKASSSYSESNTIASSKLADDVKTMTMNETNRIRAELGLKPLAESKIDTPSKPSSHSGKRNSNILHAVLTLVKELDGDGLEAVVAACRQRMDVM